MNKYATDESCLRVLVWLIWFIVLVAAIANARQWADEHGVIQTSMLLAPV